MSRETLNSSFAQLLQNLRSYKEAEARKSAGLGETSHPVMGASNGTKPTTEGERSRENESDLKAQETTMAAEAASSPPGGDQEDLTPKFGPVTPKETGHDPGSETESTKDKKQDPGTAHPAKVAYSSDEYQKEATALTAQLNQVSKSAEQLLGVLLAATNPAATNQQQPAGQQSKAEVEKAAAAGKDLADVFAGMSITPEDKQASDLYVFDLVRQAIAAGVHSADQYVKVASGFFAQKQADDDEGNPPAVEEESEEGSEPAEGDGDEGGESSEIGPEITDDSMPSEEEIIAMLTGQGMSPEGGGMPDGGSPPGAGPMGAPDEMMAGAGGLDELDPELIQALLAELQAGGAGGGDPAAGGAPPIVDPAAMGGDPMAGKMAASKKAAVTKAATAKQLASAIVKLASKQSGKQAGNGKSAKASRTSNAQKMLLELMGTGR
jgi:hypothetical protein